MKIIDIKEFNSINSLCHNKNYIFDEDTNRVYILNNISIDKFELICYGGGNSIVVRITVEPFAIKYIIDFNVCDINIGDELLTILEKIVECDNRDKHRRIELCYITKSDITDVLYKHGFQSIPDGTNYVVIKKKIMQEDNKDN